jgi:hypothetical protein
VWLVAAIKRMYFVDVKYLVSFHNTALIQFRSPKWILAFPLPALFFSIVRIVILPRPFERTHETLTLTHMLHSISK